MLYPFMTLNDETEIVHSEVLKDGSVKVYVETPAWNDFNHMTVYLPKYKITEVHNYTYDEVEKYIHVIRSTEHLIMRFAKCGGIESAPTV